jgi:hypothetical protein
VEVAELLAEEEVEQEVYKQVLIIKSLQEHLFQ